MCLYIQLLRGNTSGIYNSNLDRMYPSFRIIIKILFSYFLECRDSNFASVHVVQSFKLFPRYTSRCGNKRHRDVTGSFIQILV